MIPHPLGSEPDARRERLLQIARYLREAQAASDAGDVMGFRDGLEHIVDVIVGLELEETGTVRARPGFLELRETFSSGTRSDLRALQDHRILLYEALERAKDRGDAQEVEAVATLAIPAVEAAIAELSRTSGSRADSSRG
jgi:hypothetical protein